MESTWNSGARVDNAPGIIRRPAWDFHVEWFDLYKFVSAYYGRPWRMSDWESGQDTYRTEEVFGDPEGSEYRDASWILAVMEEWTTDGTPQDIDHIYSYWPDREPSVDVVLWHLCHKGIIPAGKYLITKWW